jgi:hypothetical protein
MPDQNGELASRRDGGHMLPALRSDPQKESAQGPRRPGGGPSRLDQHSAGMSAPLLGDPAMVSGTRSRLPDARIETEITHELLRIAEAVDVADPCDDGERHDHVDAGDRHQPRDVLVRKSRARQVALDDR